MRMRVFLFLVIWVFSGVVQAQQSSPIREFISTNLQEDGKQVRLELLVHKPAGAGPFPTLVFNHGSTGNGNDPAQFKRSFAPKSVADYFVERGWMVLFPQRRGRGASDGLYDEGFQPDRSRYACQAADSLPGVDRAIQDLDAVMEHVRTRTDVQQDRVLIGGQSRGGILAIAYAGERPDAFVGVINFVGGWLGSRCEHAVTVNTTTFKRGGKFPKPTLWIYGDSDPFYPLSHSRGNFEAFKAAGGTGSFESYWVPGSNTGHLVFLHPRLWSDHMSSYLGRVK